MEYEIALLEQAVFEASEITAIEFEIYEALEAIED